MPGIVGAPRFGELQLVSREASDAEAEERAREVRNHTIPLGE